MKHQALLQLGAELMHQFRHGNMPADRALAEYLAKRKFLGSSDRAFLADNYFHVLRHLRRIDEAIQSAFSSQPIDTVVPTSGFPVTTEPAARTWMRLAGKRVPERQTRYDRAIDTLRLGLAAIERGADKPMDIAQELSHTYPVVEGKTPLSAEALERMTARAAEVMELYAKPKRAVDSDRAYSFPSWLWSLMSFGRTEEEMRELGEAVNGQAPTTLRVNTLKTSAAEASAMLSKWKLAHKPCAFAADGLVLEGRASRGAIPRLEDGWFEMHDEGSQLVSVYAAPKPGMTVIDACAGGGGKSLHLAALMGNKGRVLADDAESARLGSMAKRAARAGATIVELLPQGDPPAADIVLIDAPCSGTGTLRRNPEARWRLHDAILEEVVSAQKALLDLWAPRVAIGGHLVYATCSLLHVENEEQTDRFLAAHPNFKLDPPEMASGLLTERGELKLSPALHGCDGFYAARFLRKS